MATMDGDNGWRRWARTMGGVGGPWAETMGCGPRTKNKVCDKITRYKGCVKRERKQKHSWGKSAPFNTIWRRAITRATETHGTLSFRKHPGAEFSPTPP